MRKLPSKVDVLGTEFSVRYVTRHREMKGLEGLCLFQKTAILIQAKLSAERKLEVLRHELAHAVLHESGCAYALSAVEPKETEEVLIRLFVPAYVHTLSLAGLV